MKTYVATLNSEWDESDDDEEPRHMLFTCGIEVTIKQHLELLQSPKKCNLLGVDNTQERLIYGHKYEWYGFPEMPPIDPNEEEYV